MPTQRTTSGKGLEHPYIKIDPEIAKGSPVKKARKFIGITITSR